MRILLVSSNSPFAVSKRVCFGGAELSLRIIGEKLAQRGHEVHYVTVLRDGTYAHPGNNLKIHPVRVYYIPYIHRYSRLIKYFNRILSQYFLENAIANVVRKSGIGLIHFYSPYPDGYCCTNVGQKLGVPTIPRISGKPWERISEYLPYVRNRIIQTYQSAKYFLPNCQYLKEEFLKFYVRDIGSIEQIKSRIEVIDIGLEIGKIEKLDKVKNRLLSVSTFKTYQKRQDILVRALRELLKRGGDYKLFLVGGGSNLATIGHLARKLGVTDKVKLTGRLRRSKLLGLLSSAEMFVFASEYEGISKALLEAMLLYLPIVASKRGGIDELIFDRHTGLLVNNEPEEFAESIEKLHGDDAEKSRLGQNARDFATLNFNPNKNILKYEKVFQRFCRS